MRPASLDWRTDKYSIIFAVGIAFVCFYHAERVMSAIAKFLVHLLGEGERRGEMGEGEVEKESRERTERVWRCGKLECTKN